MAELVDMEQQWQAADSIRTVAEALWHQVWDLHFDATQGVFRLELSGHLNEEDAMTLCYQFPYPADYDGEGRHGSCYITGPVLK